MILQANSLAEKRVPGLRSVSYATKCYVYQAIPTVDGWRKGKLLRVEPPRYFEQGMRPMVTRRVK